MLLKDMCRTVLPWTKPIISAGAARMWSVNMRGLLKLQPNIRSKIDRGFKTFATLNYMRRPPKEERAMENYYRKGYLLRFGQGVIVGVALSGLGALSLYGLGSFDEFLKFGQNFTKWPEHVKDRIKLTFVYLGASYTISALSAAAIFQSPGLVYLLSCKPTLSLYLITTFLILTDTAVRSIPYQPGFGRKQIFGIIHYAFLGMTAIPLYKLGGPLILRGAMLAAGVVAGFSIIAVSAPSKEFLETMGPIGMGLGGVAASSITSIFVPPFKTLACRLLAIPVYGIVFVFAKFILRHTKKLIKRAESLHPSKAYDPLNATLPIYIAAYKRVLAIITLIEFNNGGRR